MRKVYFDYNVYEHIKKNNSIKELIKDEISNIYEIHYSGAIAEEVYKRKCNDINNKYSEQITETNELIKYITKNRKIFSPDNRRMLMNIEAFEICYNKVKSIDTRDFIENRGKQGLQDYNLIRDCFNLGDLSDKSKKDIWKDDNIKIEIEACRLKFYDTPFYISRVQNSYGTLKKKFIVLQAWIEVLFKILELYGYYRDEEQRTAVSGIHDTSHIIYSSYCDIFVSDDYKLRKKAEAIYSFLGIPTKVVSLNKFLDYHKKNKK